MKNQTIKKSVQAIFGTALLTLGLKQTSKAQANSDLVGASKQFSDTSTAVQSNIMIGLMACAIICAGAGLISVLQKSTSESENAGKHYMKWFTGAGLFILAWGVMKAIFKN